MERVRLVFKETMYTLTFEAFDLGTSVLTEKQQKNTILVMNIFSTFKAFPNGHVTYSV